MLRRPNECALPNKRLKLTGPVFERIIRSRAWGLAVRGGAPLRHQALARSLSAIR